MAITPTIILPSPAIRTSGEACVIGLTIANTEAVSITVSGIELTDTTGVFTVGELSACSPDLFTQYTFGSAVLNPIPAWGTGDQSLKLYPGGVGAGNLVYPPGNVPVTGEVKTSTAGTYGGGSGPFATQPNFVVIPAGTTAFFTADAISNVFSDVAGSAAATFFAGSIQARISVEGIASTINTSGANTLYVVSKVIKGIQVAPLNQQYYLTRNEFGRNPLYSNFDVPSETALVFVDDTTLDITTWDIRNNYTASGGNITVVNTGPYTSAMPAAISGVSNATPSFPVGSIPPGGWKGTTFIGGAGAMSISAWPLSGSDGSTIVTVIGNNIGGGFTSTMAMYIRNEFPIGVEIIPSGNQLIYQTVALGRNTVNLQTFIIWNDGSRSVRLEPGNVVYTSSNPQLITVDNAGTCTQIINMEGQATIRCEAIYAGGSKRIDGFIVIKAALNSNFALYATA